MALAYGNYHDLSHKLRFLLFEIGIGLPQNSIDYYITLAHRETLKRLQRAAIAEGLIISPISSHHVHDWIDQLQIKLKSSLPASQFFQWNSIRDELDESIANEALAQAYKQCWNNQLRNEANRHGSLWSWITSEQTAYQTLLFLEQWGCVGNSYHPAFRAKMGLTRREVLQNSPEFQAKISIHWCALSKDKTYTPNQSIHFNKLMSHEFPTEYRLWHEKIVLNHLDPNDYYPIPVHPWQWRNQLQSMCSSMIDKKSLILMPHHQTLMPSMSADRMLPVNRPQSIIKLATSIKSPFSKNTGMPSLGYCNPGISRWINSLLKQTNNYQNTLFLANDLANISIKDDTIPKYDQQKFTASLHQNPIDLLKPNQKAVPFTSLFSISPVTNTPLIIEIIKASGMDPSTYFALYCSKILFGPLHLFLKYGVVLETQQNNILVVLENNKPEALIIKNLEQITLGEHLFFNSIEKPNLPVDTHFKSTSLDGLRTHFIQSTLQNNIRPWIDALNVEYQLPVPQLWDQVNQVLKTVFNELPNEIDPRLLSWQKHLLTQDTWQHQCSFTMRLSSNCSENIYVKELNPLRTID